MRQQPANAATVALQLTHEECARSHSRAIWIKCPEPSERCSKLAPIRAQRTFVWKPEVVPAGFLAQRC